ncbi:MAG: phosphatase PAP2 family protein, partial [Lysobacteraceae bacterium]
ALAISLFGCIAVNALLEAFERQRIRDVFGRFVPDTVVDEVLAEAKDGLRLPRPVQVDARVLDEGQPNRKWLVEAGGAPSIAALPSAGALAAERVAPDPDYGFISGHVASATALCIAIWLLFGVRSRWGRAILLAWPVLMALSRMYLGRHFLGDVLGSRASPPPARRGR